MIPAVRIILLLLISWLISQAIKIIVQSIKEKKPKLIAFLSMGGMPSSHSAFVCSLSTSIFLVEGFSTAFVISVALAALIVRDTIAIRRTIDNNTKSIAKISKNKCNQNLISHKLSEIAAGVVLGIALPIILNSVI